MTSCDLILAELLEIKAEIAALEDKFILKSKKSEFANEILRLIIPGINNIVNGRLFFIIDKLSSLEVIINSGLGKFPNLSSAMRSSGFSPEKLRNLLSRDLENYLDVLSADLSRALGQIGVNRQRADRALSGIDKINQDIIKIRDEIPVLIKNSEQSIIAKTEAKIKPTLAYILRKINDFDGYKRYIELSFNGIGRAIQFLRNSITNQQIQIQYESARQPMRDGILDRITRALDELRGKNPEGNRALENRINILEYRVNLKKSVDEFQDIRIKQIEAQGKLNGDLWALRRDFNEYKLKNNGEHTNIFNDLKVKSAEILQLKIRLGIVEKAVVALINALPGIVKSIVLSLIASGILNGIIGIGSWILSNGQKIDLATILAEISKAKDDARSAVTIAVKAEGKADNALSEIKFVTQSALNAMKRLENFTKAEIEFLTNSTRKALVRLQDRIKLSEGLLEALKLTVADIQKQVSQLRTFFTAKLQALTNRIEALKTNLLSQIGKLNLDIKKILLQLATLAAQIAGITLTVAGISALLGRLKPGMVQNTYVTNNYDQRRTTIVNNQGSDVDLTEIRSRVRSIDVRTTLMDLKLGVQLKDGLAGWMTRFTNWDVLNRLMTMMTLAATIHNAMMLSNNLGTTLISSIQNVVNFIELKDSESKGYDVQTLVKTSIESFLKNVLGTENYTAINASWKNANRIYQSAGNLLNSMLSFGDITTQALQLVSGQTSKIGNALRAWGKVGESAYGWMNPNPNFNNPILMKLNSLNETASIVEEVSQQPQSIKDAKKEVSDNAAQLAKDIGQTPEGKVGIIFPEAVKVKAEQETKKANSTAPEISSQDLEADE
ncbi:hypothetical protein WJM97_22310 [Okeanomitos corallinicola TIOX110]|uniref:Uncharacterized protein n=1 Tax=Okeanomitos corallinicola TIOX110 TaxID=3133117 RepID=A0ABZ2URY4_9CYAN